MITAAHVPLPRYRRIGYGIGDIGFNLYFTTASLYLLFYYTDVLGLTPATAGWIFAGALIWDAVCDPLMGWAASRTRSRWGRYRPWLLWGAVPLAASWVLMFVPTGLDGAALVMFALATHVLFRTLYTVVSMPYLSLSAAMTRDSAERGQLAGIRMLSATGAGLVVAFSTLKLAEAFGGGDTMRGFLMVAVLYGVVAAIIHLVVFAATAEDPEIRAEGFPSVGALAHMLVRNAPFWRIACWLMASSAAATLFGKTIPYVFKYQLGDEAGIGPALGLMTASAMVSIMAWGWLMRRTSKRTIVLAGAFTGIAGFAAFFAAGADRTLIFASLAVIGFGAGAGYLGFWAMVPDTVEYAEWRSGFRAEGVLFGVITFIQKAALGLSVGVLGEVLGAVGFVANQSQTIETLDAMRWLMFAGPIGLSLLAAAAIFHYPLDRSRHRALIDAIADRRRQSTP